MEVAAPSRLSLAMTWTVIALSSVITLLGVVWYGVSWQLHERFWSDVFGRLHGPMTIRFYLQPTLAFVAAMKDGIRDARYGHKAFFWTALWDPALLDRPALVAASKRDALTEPDPLPALQRAAAEAGLRVLPLSAHSGEGLVELTRALLTEVRRAEPVAAAQGSPVE